MIRRKWYGKSSRFSSDAGVLLSVGPKRAEKDDYVHRQIATSQHSQVGYTCLGPGFVQILTTLIYFRKIVPTILMD